MKVRGFGGIFGIDRSALEAAKIAEAVRVAVLAERAACLAIVNDEDSDPYVLAPVAEKIRARGEP